MGMNSKAMGLSLVMAGIAVFFVMSSVSSIEEQANKKFGDEVTVLVARDDIREMDTILENMIETKVVPKNFVEPTAIRFNSKVKEDSADFQSEVKRVVGSVALVAIKKGEQLSLNKITEASMRTGLAPQVTPGKRAMSISIDETNSVSKLLKPGDRVDLIVVIDPGSSSAGKSQKTAKTLYQDLVILAVGRSITNNIARRVDLDPQTGRTKIRSLTEYDGYSSVTLELDPAQAQLLASIVADTANRVILTLRNNDDTDRSALNLSRASDALIDSGRLPAAAPGGGK
jgi:pilus assembly protein CpaB